MIQEIARANDQPAVVAGHLIDRAAFGDHPLGRPVLGPEEHLRSFTPRGDRRASASAAGRPARGGAFLVGNTDHVPDDARARASCSGASRACPEPPPYEPAPPFAPGTLVETRETNQSHLRMVYRPAIDPHDRRQRAALGIYATLLGGSMGSRLFDEIREQRGLCYSVWAHDHSFADTPGARARRGPRLRASASRPTRGCARSSTSCARTGRARRRSSAPAPTPAAGSCWRSRTRARSPATPPSRRSSTTTTIDPDAAIAAIDSVTFDEVATVARGISEELAVACVGPHAAADF